MVFTKTTPLDLNIQSNAQSLKYRPHIVVVAARQNIGLQHHFFGNPAILSDVSLERSNTLSLFCLAKLGCCVDTADRQL
jgi:hypothetical protein